MIKTLITLFALILFTGCATFPAGYKYQTNQDHEFLRGTSEIEIYNGTDKAVTYHILACDTLHRDTSVTVQPNTPLFFEYPSGRYDIKAEGEYAPYMPFLSLVSFGL